MVDSKFNAEEFVGKPSVEELETERINKDQPNYIAGNSNIQFTMRPGKIT